MRVEDFDFEQRSLSDVPTTGDLISWLADFGGDDQWVLGKRCSLDTVRAFFQELER